MEKIHILQLGKKNWNEIYELTPEIHLDYVDSFAKPPEKPYDICFLDRQPMDKEISLLHREIKAYRSRWLQSNYKNKRIILFVDARAIMHLYGICVPIHRELNSPASIHTKG